VRGRPPNQRGTGARRALPLDAARTRRTVTGMFAAHHGRHVADKDHPARGSKTQGTRSAGTEGFSGLEGDFEEERRRASSAENEPTEPYEQDTLTRPTLPVPPSPAPPRA